MFLAIVLDLNRPAWETRQEDPLNCIQIFINAILLSSHKNTVKIVNSRRIIFDSSLGDNLQKSLDFTSQNTEDSRVTPSDVGYALMLCPDEIFVFDMSNEHNKDYLNFLKTMFTAEEKKIPIHGYSMRKNMLIKMVCEGTGGLYTEECTAKNFIKILGLKSKNKECFEIKCNCCNKFIDLGLVCPVCLSVYCKFIPVCKKCKAKFSFVK